ACRFLERSIDLSDLSLAHGVLLPWLRTGGESARSGRASRSKVQASKSPQTPPADCHPDHGRIGCDVQRPGQWAVRADRRERCRWALEHLLQSGVAWPRPGCCRPPDIRSNPAKALGAVENQERLHRSDASL